MTTLQERLQELADNSLIDYHTPDSRNRILVQEAADRIDALEAEIQILTAEREVYAATADRAIAQVEALTKDAERLDHIQVTGSTVEIFKFWQKPVQHSFRVGGLYKAINFDLRLAIDAAIAAQKEQT